MTMHAPGVVCIVHGLRNEWTVRDNGRLVVIVEKKFFSRKHGQMWHIRVYNTDEWLHAHSIAYGRHLSKEIREAPQKHLIPLGPEDSLCNNSMETEQEYEQQ